MVTQISCRTDLVGFNVCVKAGSFLHRVQITVQSPVAGFPPGVHAREMLHGSLSYLAVSRVGGRAATLIYCCTVLGRRNSKNRASNTNRGDEGVLTGLVGGGGSASNLEDGSAAAQRAH